MLKVQNPGTDLDVILVFRRKFIDLEKFTSGFVEYMKTQPDFYDLLYIQARVPIIKVFVNVRLDDELDRNEGDE